MSPYKFQTQSYYCPSVTILASK